MNGSTYITWRQVRVGAVVSLTLLALTVSVFIIGETGRIFGERYDLTTLMPSAGGLIEGASVRLAGQDVGKVTSIEFVPLEERQEPDHVLRIVLAIDRAVRDQIRADSEAKIRTQGLLGDKAIDITPGTSAAPILESGDTVRSAVAVDFEQMIASAAVLVDDLSGLLHNFRVLADTLLAGQGTAGRLLMDTSLYVELLGTSRSLNEFLGPIGRGEGALAQLARDDHLYLDLRSVIAGLDTLTSAMLDGSGTLSLLLTDETLYERLTSTSARADSILGTLEEGQGTLGKMLTDQQIYEELLKLVVDVQALLTELRENPKKYIPPIRVF